MKLLIESWRRYIKENKAEELSKKLETLGLHVEQSSFGYNIALMAIEKLASGEINMEKPPFVIGMIETVKSDDPCIPKTHQVGTVAVDPSVLSTGIGTYLYEVAALLVHNNFSGGITSDHESSTTVPAAKVWDRLENKFNYIKRKTPEGPEEGAFDPETGEEIESFKGGNNKFDYHGWDNTKPPEDQHPEATRDPLDDCNDVVDGRAASHRSLEIPEGRIPFVEKMISTQMQNYNKYKNAIGSEKDQQQMDGYIMRRADILFSTYYDPQKAGIHGDEK
mgnify:CR=1 FL=1|tara:strand:+ start:1442 stop:2275 length:834 start_codon:yes stop_codon:yes gene_type:complete